MFQELQGDLDVRVFVGAMEVNARLVVNLGADFHLMGDVDYDGVIGDADVAVLEAAMGSKPGDSNWNPDCDLNGDGVVDIYDGAIMNFNWGATASAVGTSPAVFTLDVGHYFVNVAFNGRRQIEERDVIGGQTTTLNKTFPAAGPGALATAVGCAAVTALFIGVIYFKSR